MKNKKDSDFLYDIMTTYDGLELQVRSGIHTGGTFYDVALNYELETKEEAEKLAEIINEFLIRTAFNRY